MYVKCSAGKELDYVQSYNELLCHPKLINNLKKLWTAPKPLASAVLPFGFEGKDMIIEAKDGSSKTSCFTTLAANIAHNNNLKRGAVIILTPKAEDVYKIQKIVEALIGFPVLALGGDKSRDTKLIYPIYPIIVAVPQQFLENKMVSMEDIEMVIISKADLFSEATIQDHLKYMIDCFVGYMKETILIQLGIDEVTLNVVAGIQKYPKNELNNLRSQSFDEIKKYKVIVQNSGLSDIIISPKSKSAFTFPSSMVNPKNAVKFYPDLEQHYRRNQFDENGKKIEGHRFGIF
uniref:ATP-dependent RNA helicase n=1 Tax=Panagrolaimus sp. PS1159 TaxID=55785 RepID=A0AC35EUA5_9BILA